MRQRTSGPLSGVALGGVVLGHLLGYAIAFPATAVRDHHLAETGHAGFPDVAAFAAVVAAVGLVLVAGRAVRRRSCLPTGAIAARLAAMQVPVFLLLELAERRLDVAATLADHGVVLGLVAQLAVAITLAVFVRGIERAVRTIASARRPASRVAAATAGAVPPAPGPPRRRRVLAVRRLRAPPALLPR